MITKHGMPAVARLKRYITRKGKADLKEEYDFLVTTRRQEVISRLQQTREMGDISENSAYDDAREEQSLLEARIEELEKVLKSAVVVVQQERADFVVIGSSIVVDMNGEIHDFQIVGSMEADPAKGKISNESPVGKALLGTKVGEALEVSVGPVKLPVKIIEIR